MHNVVYNEFLSVKENNTLICVWYIDVKVYGYKLKAVNMYSRHTIYANVASYHWCIWHFSSLLFCIYLILCIKHTLLLKS